MARPVPDLETLYQYVAKGLLSRVDLGSLSIFNYTDRCTWDGAWDEVTQVARGLVIDRETGEVVARAFDKFFNHGERGVPGGLPDHTPDVVTVKHDGSLGIGFRWSTSSTLATGHGRCSSCHFWPGRLDVAPVPASGGGPQTHQPRHRPHNQPHNHHALPQPPGTPA